MNMGFGIAFFLGVIACAVFNFYSLKQQRRGLRKKIEALLKTKDNHLREMWRIFYLSLSPKYQDEFRKMCSDEATTAAILMQKNEKDSEVYKDAKKRSELWAVVHEVLMVELGLAPRE